MPLLWAREEMGIHEALGWEMLCPVLCSRAAPKPVRETGKKALDACLVMAKVLFDFFNLGEMKEY